MWKQRFLMGLSALTAIVFSASSFALDMHLEVGESQSLESEAGVELNISRKGIVDVTSQSSTSWRITALKVGFVLLKIKREGQIIESVHIFVQKAKEEEESKSPIDMLTAICKASRLSCDFETNIIAGEMDDYRQFFQAKRLCALQKNILFTVTLSKNGLKQVKKDLGERLNSHDPFEISEAGEIVFFIPCQEGEIKALQQAKNTLPQLGPYFEKPILRCLSASSGDFHLLEARVLLSKDLTSEDWDLFKQLDNQFEQHRRLELFIKENKVDLIAEPLFLLTESKEAFVISGGEVETLAFEGRQDKDISLTRLSSWKEYGFRMQVKLKRLSQTTATLDFAFSIKQPQQNGQFNNLNSNSIQSAALLSLGQSKVVACIELGSKGDHQMMVPVLSKTPLLAPFFTAKSKNSSLSKVLISLCWREDKGEGFASKKVGRLEPHSF